MSAAMIYQRMVQEISALESGFSVDGMLFDVLRRFEPSLLQLVYEWMCHCGHDSEQAVERCVPILIQHCAIHLADDLADGDCFYLDNREADGSTLLCLLQNLVAYTLERNLFLHDQKSVFYRSMHKVGIAQLFETKHKDWDYKSAKYAAESLNGEQCKAYFSLAAESNPDLEIFGTIGYLFGSVFHVATDRRTHDGRFWSLVPDEQIMLIEWAKQQLVELRRLNIACLDRRLGALAQALM